MTQDLDQLCINTIRFLSVDAVEQANAGHPGLPMGMADPTYVLWTQFLKHNPTNPKWIDRDRFVLSAGQRTGRRIWFDRGISRQPLAVEICAGYLLAVVECHRIYGGLCRRVFGQHRLCAL